MNALSRGLRVVCGGRWTTDERWVVVGPRFDCDHDTIVYDPDNGNPYFDIWDCKAWIKENR